MKPATRELTFKQVNYLRQKAERLRGKTRIDCHCIACGDSGWFLVPVQIIGEKHRPCPHCNSGGEFRS